MTSIWLYNLSTPQSTKKIKPAVIFMKMTIKITVEEAQGNLTGYPLIF
jgi:hypothetical protein